MRADGDHGDYSFERSCEIQLRLEDAVRGARVERDPARGGLEDSIPSLKNLTTSTRST
jgi:hypothetical protein